MDLKFNADLTVSICLYITSPQNLCLLTCHLSRLSVSSEFLSFLYNFLLSAEVSASSGTDVQIQKIAVALSCTSCNTSPVRPKCKVLITLCRGHGHLLLFLKAHICFSISFLLSMSLSKGLKILDL